jgi:hypothetical protein
MQTVILAVMTRMPALSAILAIALMTCAAILTLAS